MSTETSQLREVRDWSDLAAWVGFNAKYRPMLLRWCRALGLRHEEAEDLAQEILIEVAGLLKTFSYDPSKTFRGWLRKITWRRVQDFHRRAGARATLLGDAVDWLEAPGDVDDPPEDPSKDRGLRALAEKVQMAVQRRSSPRSWRLFVEVDQGFRTPSEVAREFGMSYASAHRALGRVRKRLAKEGQRVLTQLAAETGGPGSAPSADSRA